ncbi:MAG: hypothetical protein ACFWUJ_16460 [Pseudomonas fragi]
MQNPSQRPLWQIYLIFLAPMVLSNFLQSFSGTLNGIYVGQLLGTQALAAVSGMFPIVFFFIALVIGLGAGASVLIGQAWGARETALVKQITGATLTLGAAIAWSPRSSAACWHGLPCRRWAPRLTCWRRPSAMPG